MSEYIRGEVLQESHREDSRRLTAQPLRRLMFYRTSSPSGDSKKTKEPGAIVNAEKALM